jgi:hypothetical protein
LYEIRTYEEAVGQIAALPRDALGMVVYLVLDIGRHVDVVRVHRLG